MGVGMATPVLFGFLRLATNPRMFTRPMSINEAVDCVECWMERPNVHRVDGGPRHLEICFRLLQELGAGANLTTDVQLAAIAMELNGTLYLYSNDGDFRRIKGLRLVNPLEP